MKNAVKEWRAGKTDRRVYNKIYREHGKMVKKREEGKLWFLQEVEIGV